jgi:hypothetical protein
MCVLAALGLAGCASHAGNQESASDTGPATVALRYTQALFAGDFAAASRYVAPTSRNVFLVLTDGLGHSSITSRSLAVGSTTVTGSAAVTILTGTICSTGSMASLAPGEASSAERCVTNTDAHSTNAVFRVALTRGSDARWMVVYRAPAADTSGSNSAERSSAAP